MTPLKQFSDGAILRMAEPYDAEALISLWRKVFGDTEEFIRGILAESTSLVVQTEHGLVAMCHVLNRDGVKYLYALATDPVFRGKGYGTTLVRAARDLFPTETMALVPGESSLIAWYVQQGFTVSSIGPHVTMTDPPLAGFQITDPMS